MSNEDVITQIKKSLGEKRQKLDTLEKESKALRDLIG